MHGFTAYQMNMVLVVVLVSCLLWWPYNRFVRQHVHFMGTVIWDPPRWIKCDIFPNISNNPKKNLCEKVNIDMWSVGHFVLYTAIGLLVPGKYAFVLALSIACEIFEYYSGWRAKWIFDPVVNMLGYAAGSVLAPMVVVPAAFHKCFDGTRYTLAMTAAIAVLLVLNRPAFMPNPDKYL